MPHIPVRSLFSQVPIGSVLKSQSSNSHQSSDLPPLPTSPHHLTGPSSLTIILQHRNREGVLISHTHGQPFRERLGSVHVWSLLRNNMNLQTAVTTITGPAKQSQWTSCFFSSVGLLAKVSDSDYCPKHLKARAGPQKNRLNSLSFTAKCLRLIGSSPILITRGPTHFIWLVFPESLISQLDEGAYRGIKRHSMRTSSLLIVFLYEPLIISVTRLHPWKKEPSKSDWQWMANHEEGEGEFSSWCVHVAESIIALHTFCLWMKATTTDPFPYRNGFNLYILIFASDSRIRHITMC